MTMPAPGSGLFRQSPRQLHDGRADWAEAMAAEATECRSAFERVRWVLGCGIARLHLPDFANALYLPALALGLTLMAAYEWRADESAATVLLLALISIGLGALCPRRALVSGILIGLVVAGVMAFEVLTGVQPAYETQGQTVTDSLRWTVLLAPSLAAAFAGGAIGRRFGIGGAGR